MVRKKVLFIAPQFPPCNLAAVHRTRLFAMHLKLFGWEPIILTCHESGYEENLDLQLVKLLPSDLRIVKVKALPVSKLRIFGDISLRAMPYLIKKAKAILDAEKIDLVYIPIPPFYSALIGPWLRRSRGVKYGIDYIDPWVHKFPGSERVFSRAWLSSVIARWLEPLAIKNTSLITGVSEAYYNDVLHRNPGVVGRAITGAMPYGGEASDHHKVKELGIKTYLFPDTSSKTRFVYAGAMLPRAMRPLKIILENLARNRAEFANLEFHFIGTGKSPNDKTGFNVKPLAEECGIYNQLVFEYPARIPYLDVLVHLEAADAIFILGSTEAHYTPSKVYQAVLSGKPILAVLHEASSAVSVIRRSRAGTVLDFAGEDTFRISSFFNSTLEQFVYKLPTFNPQDVDQSAFEKYSAREVTRNLASLFDRTISNDDEKA